MHTLSLAIGVWARIILINSIIGAIAMCIQSGTSILIAFFFLAIGSVIFTSPLLIFITAIIRVSNCIPYDTEIKFKWLSFMLILLAMAFYGLLIYLVGDPIINENEFPFFGVCTIVSILVAMRFSRKSFRI